MSSAHHHPNHHEGRANTFPHPSIRTNSRSSISSSTADGANRANAPSPQFSTSGISGHKRTSSGNPRPSSKPNSKVDQERMRDKRPDDRAESRRQSVFPSKTTTATTTTTTTTTMLYARTKSPIKGHARIPSESGKATPESLAKEQTPKVWDPKASLIAHTTAPLACRVALPPRSEQAPQSLQPRPLADMSLEEQEAAMVEDLLFVFMGYEGQYIRFSTYDPDEDHDRLMGPSYTVQPGLDPSLLDLTNGMLKMASHCSALERFVDVQSRDEMGSVSHALCASVRKILTDYLVMIAQLETQFLTNDKFTLHILNIHTLPTAQMMSHLYALAIDLLRKNALLDDESDDESDESMDNDKFIDMMREGGDLASSGLGGKKSCKGGGVLELVTKRLESLGGDPSAKALLTSLLRDASRPYMAMLNEWLHHGGIKDPHGEFLIKESKSIRRDRLEEDYTDEYWERRYALKKDDIPPQLVSVANKVHLAGKYLNVVRECGGVDISKEIRDVPRSFDDVRLLQNVNNAYASANDSLMQLLLTTHQLPARLRSLKHYFFLDPADYFSHFLDLAGTELRKRAKEVNVGKLQSLLDLVLRHPGSVVSLDPFKDSVKLEIDEVSLAKRLQRVVNISGMEIGEVLQLSNQNVESDASATGFTSLQLDYAVPFPVSLVISRKTIWRYQTLFRYLLSLRVLELHLSQMWQNHGRTPVWCHRSSDPRIELFKRQACALRSRMLTFVQQMLYYCTAEVIEPNWLALMSRLGESEEAGVVDGKKGPTRTVDELMQDHVDFLDTCLKECMLTNSRLLRINAKIIQSCTIYTQLFTQFSRDLACCDRDLAGDTRPARMSSADWATITTLKALQRKSYQQNPTQPAAQAVTLDEKMGFMYRELTRWEDLFSNHLQKLMSALNYYAATETVVLLSLCARLSTVNHGTPYAGIPRHSGDSKEGSVMT